MPVFCFKKAYDSVWHKGLFSKLENLNMGGGGGGGREFFEIIKDMYKNSKCAVKIQNKVTIFSHLIRGKTRLSIESYVVQHLH